MFESEESQQRINAELRRIVDSGVLARKPFACRPNNDDSVEYDQAAPRRSDPDFAKKLRALSQHEWTDAAADMLLYPGSDRDRWDACVIRLRTLLLGAHSANALDRRDDYELISKLITRILLDNVEESLSGSDR